jgi:proteasome accessory factor B
MIMESKRHPTQVVHIQPDKSVIFEAEVAGIEEIAIWILGYGKEAEALEPESLRDYIIEEVTGAAANYQKDDKETDGLACAMI